MQQPPNYPNYEGWQQSQPQQSNTQYLPQQPQWPQPQAQYPPPQQQYYPPPQWQQVLPPLPPPFWQQTGRPVRVGVKTSSIACIIVGVAIASFGAPFAPFGGLVLFVGFILVFLI